MTSRETCHNCGMTSDSIPTEGYRFGLKQKAENRYSKESTRTVWCCSEECAIQAIAITKYGSTTHRWPITLAQFRSTKPLRKLGLEA